MYAENAFVHGKHWELELTNYTNGYSLLFVRECERCMPFPGDNGNDDEDAHFLFSSATIGMVDEEFSFVCIIIPHCC